MRSSNRIRLVAFGAMLALASQAAVAANVNEIQGQVEISRSGGPFRAVSGPTICNAGDVVRARPNGRAQVEYLGSVVTATPGNPVTCAGPAAAATTGAPGAAGAAGGAASASTAAVVGGAVVIAAGVAGVVALARKSASP
jgi:hypothetical protein